MTRTIRNAQLLVLLAACGGPWIAIPHEVAPESVQNPHAEIEALAMLAANHPVMVRSQPQHLVALYQYGPYTLVYPSMAEIQILSKNGQFAVNVLDGSGRRLAQFRFHDETHARRLADVLAALKQQAYQPAISGGTSAHSTRSSEYDRAHSAPNGGFVPSGDFEADAP